MLNTSTTAPTTNVPVPLPLGSLVKHKNKIYTAKFVNYSHGYFILPINSTDINLGFWAQFNDCQAILN